MRSAKLVPPTLHHLALRQLFDRVVFSAARHREQHVHESEAVNSTASAEARSPPQANV